VHQYPFYPGSGAADEVGGGEGSGRVVNVPMPAGFGDAEWTAAFRRVVVPVARAFAPEFVLVSAGFDAHAHDPLGGMRVTDAGFAAMADEVLAIARAHASGRVVAVLEGGYDLAALASSVGAVLRRMSGKDSPAAPRDDIGRFGAVQAEVRAAQARHWKL